MPPLSRRVYQRFPCDLPVDIYSPQTAVKLAEGRILNLSLGGAEVESPHLLQSGVPYEFRFRDLKIRLKLVGRVAWGTKGSSKDPRRGFRQGVSFNTTSSQEASLRKIIDRLRRDQWPNLENRMQNYWNL